MPFGHADDSMASASIGEDLLRSGPKHDENRNDKEKGDESCREMGISGE